MAFLPRRDAIRRHGRLSFLAINNPASTISLFQMMSEVTRTAKWYWLGIAMLFVFAAWQRFALPFDPIADPDTWGYLSPALRKLLGAEFGHTHGRNFVYPGFLFLVLRIFGDFRAIVIVQHLLGLMAGAILLLTWRGSRALVPKSGLTLNEHNAIGLFITGVFLVAGEPIRFEMQLRPEGVATFLISVTLYFSLKFIISGFIEKRSWPMVGYGVVTGFASILLASVKPSFGFVAVVTLLLITLVFFRSGGTRQKLVLAAGITMCSAVLLVPEYFLSARDEASKTFLPTQLFVMHADIIEVQMADDIERSADTRYPRDLLIRVQQQLKTELEKSKKPNEAYFPFPSLGFSPDYLMYQEGSINALLRREFGNSDALCAFYRYYYVRIWRERPLAVVGRIVRQLGLFYRWKSPVYVRRDSLVLADGYRNGVTSLQLQPYPDLWTAYPPAVQFMDRTEVLSREAPPIEQSRLIRLALSFLARLYVPLLLATVAAGFLGACWPAYRRQLGWLTAWVGFLFLWNWACCLEVAIVHSLDVPRYSSVQMLFTCLAECSAIWLFWEMALRNKRL